jgi:hypothetical protein
VGGERRGGIVTLGAGGEGVGRGEKRVSEDGRSWFED